MKVSKDRWLGPRIENLNDLVVLAKDNQPVVLRSDNTYYVRPATSVLKLSLQEILNHELYNAVDHDAKSVGQ